MLLGELFVRLFFPDRMEAPKMDKELLLGYLLNALDARESVQVERNLERNPSLRSELAALQQEIAPLDYIADSVEPPPGLASRTCAQVWATLDSKEPDSKEPDSKEPDPEPNSHFYLDPAYFSPESILPHSFLLPYTDPEDGERDIPKKTTRRINIDEDEENEEHTPRSSRIGLIASTSVGILVAVFLFPMIQYVQRGARSYVAESWVSEIARRVDQYEQINQGSPLGEDMQPINLALSGWRELHSDSLSFFYEAAFYGHHHDFAPQGVIGIPIAPFGGECPAIHVPEKHDVTRKQESPLWSDSMLLIVPGEETVARSAYGQYFLFKDGRTFVRDLQNMEPPKKR